jgi:hypothetical protein
MFDCAYQPEPQPEPRAVPKGPARYSMRRAALLVVLAVCVAGLFGILASGHVMRYSGGG